MRIISLIENNASEKQFFSEHGLSLYIETGEHKILFDMGQTDLFCQNAEILGVDLSRVDIAVLSHGHYDHGGGLQTFLTLNKKAPVYISAYAFEPHYNGVQKYIGLDNSLRGSDRLLYTDSTVKFNDRMTLFHCNDRAKSFDLGSFGLKTKEEDHFVPDDFRHEQYLLIEEEGKKILFSGCSHKGILNIVEWFTPDVLVGGFHFSRLPLDENLESYAMRLNSFPTTYYTCHCTGQEQYTFMKKHMNHLFYLSAGQTINL